MLQNINIRKKAEISFFFNHLKKLSSEGQFRTSESETLFMKIFLHKLLDKQQIYFHFYYFRLSRRFNKA